MIKCQGSGWFDLAAAAMADAAAVPVGDAAAVLPVADAAPPLLVDAAAAALVTDAAAAAVADAADLDAPGTEGELASPGWMQLLEATIAKLSAVSEPANKGGCEWLHACCSSMQHRQLERGKRTKHCTPDRSPGASASAGAVPSSWSANDVAAWPEGLGSAYGKYRNTTKKRFAKKSCRKVFTKQLTKNPKPKFSPFFIAFWGVSR
jgi:hypothetical protein